MKNPDPAHAPTAELLALLEQVEFVLAVTTPMTPQQVEVWPELRQRAKAARAAVKLAASNPGPLTP